MKKFRDYKITEELDFLFSNVCNNKLFIIESREEKPTIVLYNINEFISLTKFLGNVPIFCSIKLYEPEDYMIEDLAKELNICVEDLFNTVKEVQFYINYNGLMIYYFYNDYCGKDKEYLNKLLEEENKKYDIPYVLT